MPIARFPFIRGFLLFAGLTLGSGLAQAENAGPSDEELLALYDGLRVADVSDGMDKEGLADVGLMEQAIVPLWKDVDTMSHQFRGIAITARYVPTNRVVETPKESTEAFERWEGQWYTELSDEPYVPLIEEGSVVVLDVQGDGDTGSVGSYNSLDWIRRGARGIVSNGGVRDIDEIIKQRVPVYLDMDNRGRGIRPGRNELESVNKPVSVAGALVNPGDVIVADGDGVIVVPRKHAVAVAEYARRVLEKDKGARRDLYRKMDRPMDPTVAE